MDKEDLLTESDEPGRHNATLQGHQTSNRLSKAQLESLIDDETYKRLERHFLMKGKGRRPELPPVQRITNKLLVQLFFIMEKANSTMMELKSWLALLVPDMATVTESRIYKKIHATMDSCFQVCEADAISILEEEHNFHSVSPPLSSVGLNRLHLTGVEPFAREPSETVSNEIVVALEHFRSKEKGPLTFVRQWISRLCTACESLTDSQIRNKVNAVLKKHKHLTKNNRGNSLADFLKEDFFKKTDLVPQYEQMDCSECMLKDRVIENLKREKCMLSKQSVFSSVLIDEAKTKNAVIEDLQKDKCDLLKSNKELEDKYAHDLSVVRDELDKEKHQHEIHIQELENAKKSKLYRLNHDYKRKLHDIDSERDALIEQINESRHSSTLLAQQVHSLKKQKKSEQTMKSKYKAGLQYQKEINCQMSEMLMFDQESTITLREEGSSHRFSDSIRKTFYALREDINVSAGNCSKVVSTVARNLFDTDLKVEDLPSESSALNFSNEAHVIAKQQVVSEIKKSDHFTYACDGTSRDKAHFLEQHIYLSNGRTLSLGFSEIATDDSETLLEKCVGIFKELSELYCMEQDSNNADDLLKEIIKKMKCLMSDRAAVCKAFDKKMAKFKEGLLGGEDCSTQFVYCNAHFLLALSAAAEDGVKCVEEEMIREGEKLGRDQNASFVGWKKNEETAAVRLIRLAASVLGPRCDEKSGCRQEWLAFCSSHGIKSGFTSFRSNRFNNLFHNATAVLKHRKQIETFLDQYVSHSNLKLESIGADLKDERIISSIAVLSFMHTFFTEPYWQLMKSSEKTYADFPQYVKAMVAFFETWSSASDQNLNFASPVFSDFEPCVEGTLLLKEFWSSESFHRDSFNCCLEMIVKKCEAALKRQLSDFLEGGVFGGELEDDVRTVLGSFPLTNLTGENLFGDMDYSMKLKRNASLHSRSTTNMWKRNKTVKWLDKVSPSESKKLVQKAIKYGPEWRQRHRQEKKAVESQITQKINENKRIKCEKDVKSKEKELSVVNAILAHGGVATTKADLDALCSGPQAVERLKDQIRYRSLIMGEKITLKGNKQMLYERLLSKITSSTSTSE